MTRSTREQMIQRERLRIQALTKQHILNELYGDKVKKQLRSLLLEKYLAELDTGGIVACAVCGTDCVPEDKVEDSETEWFCEKCSED